MADLQATAQRFHSVIYEPRFEKTAAEVEQTTTNAIKQFQAALDIIASRKVEEATFTNTLQAMDQAAWELDKVRSRLALLQKASTNTSVRNASSESARQLSKAVIDAGYRPELYAAIKAVARSDTGLKDEDARLLQYYLLRGKRVGLDLSPEQQEQMKEQWRQLVETQLAFRKNLSAPVQRLKFSRAELKGVKESFLKLYCAKVGSEEYLVPVNVYLDDLKVEETRKRLWLGYMNTAANQNGPLMQRILEIRNSIAHELGYSSWADYSIRGSLAGSVTNAHAFCEDVSSKFRNAWSAQLTELTRIKAKETRDPNARIEYWDLSFYENKRDKHRSGGSPDRLAIYFPTTHIVDGISDVCKHVFRLRIEPVRPSDGWAEGVRLFAVTDEPSGEPLGLIYLDLYQRNGKRNDYYTSDIIGGRQLSNGSRQCPVATVEMGLVQYHVSKRFELYPRSVEALCHEFGHALHEILSRSKYAAFAGNDVSRDYAEVPSELLGMWAQDRDVLNVITHRNPWYARTMPPKRFNWLKAQFADYNSSLYEWSMAWALADLALHSDFKGGLDAIALSNQILSEHYLPLPPDVAPISSYLPLIDYNSAVYSHVWCEAIAADLLTEFQNAPGGLLDSDIGMRLRHEIMETGNARPPKVSIEKFLGRPYSMEPFFKQHGLQAPGEKQ